MVFRFGLFQGVPFVRSQSSAPVDYPSSHLSTATPRLRRSNQPWEHPREDRRPEPGSGGHVGNLPVSKLARQEVVEHGSETRMGHRVLSKWLLQIYIWKVGHRLLGPRFKPCAHIGSRTLIFPPEVCTSKQLTKTVGFIIFTRTTGFVSRNTIGATYEVLQNRTPQKNDTCISRRRESLGMASLFGWRPSLLGSEMLGVRFQLIASGAKRGTGLMKLHRTPNAPGEGDVARPRDRAALAAGSCEILRFGTIGVCTGKTRMPTQIA